MCSCTHFVLDRVPHEQAACGKTTSSRRPSRWAPEAWASEAIDTTIAKSVRMPMMPIAADANECTIISGARISCRVPKRGRPITVAPSGMARGTESRGLGMNTGQQAPEFRF